MKWGLSPRKGHLATKCDKEHTHPLGSQNTDTTVSSQVVPTSQQNLLLVWVRRKDREIAAKRNEVGPLCSGSPASEILWSDTAEAAKWEPMNLVVRGLGFTVLEEASTQSQMLARDKILVFSFP